MRSELRKLVLAKSIFLHGCDHSNNRDELSRVLAIHHFDFAVEMILRCIAAKYNIVTSPRKDPSFKELWEKITRNGVDLPLKDDIFRLHYLRNLVQHTGTVPSAEDVIALKDSVEKFCEEVIKKVFKISFSKLSLAQVIKNEELRRILQEAENLLRREMYKECIMKCEEALVKATFDIGNIFYKAGMLTGYFTAGKEFRKVINKDYAEKYKGERFYTAIKDLSKAFLQLLQAATGMQFLDEYRVRFLKYRKIIENLHAIPEDKLKDKAYFALDFVIGLILKWQNEGIIESSNKNTT